MGLSLLPATIAWKQKYTCVHTHEHAHTHTHNPRVFKVLILVFALFCLTLKICVCLLSHIWLCDSMNCSLPGCSVMKFSRQEYWSVLPFPSPKDLPDPGIESSSLDSCIGRWILYHGATWEAQNMYHRVKNQMWKTKVK